MEFLLVVLIVVVWVSLYSHISKMNAHTDALRKDIYSLKKLVESRLEEIKRPETTSVTELTEEMPEKTVVEELVPPVIEVPVEVPVEAATEYLQKEMVSGTVAEVQPEKKKVVPQPVIKPFGLVKEKKKVDYEKYIGENLFGKIGILVLVVGMGLFVKYAIDKNWINEVFRTVLGFVVGGGLLVLSQRLKNTYRTFSSLLAGGAFAIFYVTVADFG